MLQKDYLAEYGTSLSGLMAVHGMDPAEFLDYVHDVDLSALQPDPILKQKIHALPGRKFIYTNGSKKHAYNVASHLDLFELFDASFGIEDADYVPKPKRSPYIKFCDQFNIDPNKAIFFEDSARNLEVPKFMGMSTVLIQSKPSNPSGTMATEPHEVALQNPDSKPDYIDYFTNNLTQWLPLYP